MLYLSMTKDNTAGIMEHSESGIVGGLIGFWDAWWAINWIFTQVAVLIEWWMVLENLVLGKDGGRWMDRMRAWTSRHECPVVGSKNDCDCSRVEVCCRVVECAQISFFTFRCREGTREREGRTGGDPQNWKQERTKVAYLWFSGSKMKKGLREDRGRDKDQTENHKTTPLRQILGQLKTTAQRWKNGGYPFTARLEPSILAERVDTGERIKEEMVHKQTTNWENVRDCVEGVYIQLILVRRTVSNKMDDSTDFVESSLLF